MTPVGLLLAAPVAEVAGVAIWYLAGGALCLAVGAVMLARPDLLDIERAGKEVLGSLLIKSSSSRHSRAHPS
jgi:hypothetical protein